MFLRRALLASALGLLVVLSSACREGERTLMEERFDVGGPIVLVVDVADAAVLVEAGERAVVAIAAEFVDERYEYAATYAEGTVTVRLDRSQGLASLGVRGDAEVRLAIPRGSRVEIDAANGGVTVLAPIEGGAIRTSNGAIEVGESEGMLSLVTSNGSLLVEEHEGALDAQTANGAITIREHFGGPVAAETKNGSIEYRGELVIDTANRLTTTNGRVSIELLGQPSLILDARASEGEISSRYALLDVTRSEGSLRGRIGAGAATLEVRTTNGAIDVR